MASADDARQWLQKMSHAVETLNYEGTFVYLHAGRMDAMHIIHRYGPDGEQERLVSLTGAAREVIRNNRTVTCVLPDSKSVVVNKSLPRTPFPGVLPDNLDRLSQDYSFQVLGSDRMTGVAARVIAIKPKDRYRYGHRLWLAKDTDLLLKSDVTDRHGVPVEQVMFTRLAVKQDIPESVFNPALNGKDFTWYRSSGGKVPPTGKLPIEWQVANLPSGFQLVHHSRHRLPSGDNLVDHMVYSDGLATVSVYIEKPDSDDRDRLRGASSMGALNAYGGTVDGYQVTVVGEVPEATVSMIGRSVRRAR
ncbi:MAG: MucB/RseB C-terminal domain-containing protein [Gammaproteobacteria bacterium]